MDRSSQWTEFFSVDCLCVSELKKVTQGKGQLVSQNGQEGPPQTSLGISSHSTSRHSAELTTGLTSLKKDILIQTFLFYRKSNPTRLGSIAQMTQKNKEKKKKASQS